MELTFKLHLTSGAIDVALGGGAAGAYTTCNQLWNQMEMVSLHVSRI